MAWSIKWDKRALSELKHLDKIIQKNLLKYLRKRVETDSTPKSFGKGLSHEKHGLWCYRVQTYRIICCIDEGEQEVKVLSVGHRKDVYKYFSL